MDEKQFLIDNYANMGAIYCSQVLNKKINCVRMRAKRLGLKVSKNTISLNHPFYRGSDFKFEVDHKNFLDIKDKEIAYILGYIWADGHISIRKQSEHTNKYRIMLTIDEKDAKLIYPVFLTTGKWTYGRSGGNMICISTGNKFLAKFMMEMDYHIKSHTSPEKILSKIPEHLKHYWWRGYFDGDGCITNCGLIKKWRVSFTSNKDQDWGFAQKYFYNLGIQIFIGIKNTLLSKSSCVSFSQQESICKFFLNIYPETYFDFGLPRKYNKLLLAYKNIMESPKYSRKNVRD